MRNFLRLVLSIVVCESVGIIGSVFTLPAITTWYITLNKPSFNPPNWLFGPVWTILFLLMGVSAYLIWNKGLKKKGVKTALLIFAVQLALNFLWSLFFFGLHSPLLAFIDIIFLWLAILLTIAKFWNLSRPAAGILFPYLLWVSFASFLNFAIIGLNH